MFNETKSHSSLSPESITLAAHGILISAVLFLLDTNQLSLFVSYFSHCCQTFKIVKCLCANKWDLLSSLNEFKLISHTISRLCKHRHWFLLSHCHISIQKTATQGYSDIKELGNCDQIGAVGQWRHQYWT